MTNGITREKAGFFQVVPVRGGQLRWRLLSPNNRELGRGVEAYEDLEACILGIKQMLVELEELSLRYVLTPDNRWTWRLVGDGTAVAVSGVSFDRRLRCVDAAQRFTLVASSADVRQCRRLRRAGGDS